MINLIIFDLDGVLYEAKHIHFETLNDALDSEYKISWEEHLSKYDGLKTNQKLQLLTKEKKLPQSEYDRIWNKKQDLTLKKIKSIKKSDKLIECFEELSLNDVKLAVCSNSIRKTVLTVLSRLGIIEYFDLILSNQDVNNGKPHPEIYWKCMSEMNFLPEETLIVEDSPPGLLSASRSGANVMRVSSPNEVNYQNIKKHLNMELKNVTPKWKDDKLNVLIPMAGAGSRFESAGYTFPKPLIEVNGKPMIQVVVENLNMDANFIFIVQKKHREKYNLDTLLNLISANCRIIEVDGITEGAACTTLLAKELIDNDFPLLMSNSDQFIEWDSNEFMYKMNESDCDGGIVTFTSTHPKWSFAKLNDFGYVTEVAEKNPISNIATVGVYYWKKGSDYVKFAEQMIEKNIRVNNEFYVCPVFNESLIHDKKICTFNIEKMWGLGTPEDLNIFLTQYEKNN